MKTAHQKIKQPLITATSTLLRDANGVYCFTADVRANKIEIARAIEKLFGVKVVEVRTARVKGKNRRVGRLFSKAPDWKKAWVRLAPGEKAIEFFEAT